MLPDINDDPLEPGVDRDNYGAIWGFGIIIAGIAAFYGLKCIWLKSGTFFAGGRWNNMPMHVEGGMAVGVGMFYLSIGCFLHFKYFWSCHERFLGWAQIGIIASLIGVAAGMITFIYHWIGPGLRLF